MHHVFFFFADTPLGSLTAGQKLLESMAADGGNDDSEQEEDEAPEQAEDDELAEDDNGDLCTDEDAESLRSDSLDDKHEETFSSRFSSSSSGSLQIPHLDLPGR